MLEAAKGRLDDHEMDLDGRSTTDYTYSVQVQS